MTTTTTAATMSYPHYIFGYGSLICPASRAVTAPTLQHRLATPVRVRDLERLWSFPVAQCGMTFMGIRLAKNATCVGVLIPVNDEELMQFDARELGYDRIPLEHDRIEKLAVDHGATKANHASQERDASCYFERLEKATHSSADEKPNVWVYLQQEPSPINPVCPLAQTYIDIIMRGCLTISHDFCREFLQTTRGWSAHDFEASPEKGHSTQSTTATYWINDRHDPLYTRADQEYSLQNGDLLDRLLKQHRPEWVHRQPM